MPTTPVWMLSHMCVGKREREREREREKERYLVVVVVCVCVCGGGGGGGGSPGYILLHFAIVCLKSPTVCLQLTNDMGLEVT